MAMTRKSHSRKGRTARKVRKGRKSLRRRRQSGGGCGAMRQSGGGCGATCPNNYWINELTGRRVYGNHVLYENWEAPPGKMTGPVRGYVCQKCGCKQ